MRPSVVKNSFNSTNDELKYKIILVGDSSVGKSSLFLKFIHGNQFSPFQTNITTIDFNTKDVYLPEENQSVKLFIWDTAGQ
jgi:GTPase SAR1 family protein